MVKVDFRRKTIFLDTAPLIYYIEGNSQYQPELAEVFQQNGRGEFIFITSTITLLEVLVKPLKDGKYDLAEHIKIY